jgi:hypothetical protein
VRQVAEGSRDALIVATDTFDDPGLSQLRAPAHDAAALARVLGDERIGRFHVDTLVNAPAHEISLAIEDFFADRRSDDLLLLHISCHGVKGESGDLHFATTNTNLRRLAATSVPAEFVNRRMVHSRSKRIVLLLDCCYAGAFARGMTARAGPSVGIGDHLAGEGRAVITASDVMEYAFEDASLADASSPQPSVFTSALVEGLTTGDADVDQDGYVELHELYDYVYHRVREVTPGQTPTKWEFGLKGELYLARRARPVETPTPLEPELQQLLDSPLSEVRTTAVTLLAPRLQERHEGRALAARLALERLVHDDSRTVAAAAAAELSKIPRTPDAPHVDDTEPDAPHVDDTEPDAPHVDDTEPGAGPDEDVNRGGEPDEVEATDADGEGGDGAEPPPGPTDREIEGQPDIPPADERSRGRLVQPPRLVWGVATLLVIVVAGLWLADWGPQEPTTDVAIGHLATPPTIDGSSGDWPSGPVIETSHPGDPEKYTETAVDSTWRLGWDEEALYVFVEVTDPEVQTGQADEPWLLQRGDSIELHLGADPTDLQDDEGLRPDDLQIMIGPRSGDTSGEAVSGIRRPEANGDPPCGTIFAPDRLADTSTVAAFATLTEAGYDIEAKVPWDVLGHAPSTDVVYGMNLTVSDASDGETERRSTNEDREAAKHCPARWNTARLLPP